MKYLSETGLAHFWGKIKTYVSSGYKKLDGSNYYVKLTGGNGNTTGYRLVLAKDVGAGGTWNNCSLKLQTISRHTGNGVLNIDFRLTGSLTSFSENTRYYGSLLDSSLGWTQYYNSETGMYYLFWKFFDHDICYVDVSQQRAFSNALPSNGEWIEGTIDESIYGKEYPIRVNTANSATKATQDSDGKQINTTYLKKSSDYLNTHPENSGVILPFINNDIAFLTAKGGTAKVYYDSVEQNISTFNLFDASPTYLSLNPKNLSLTTLVIELTLHKSFDWTNTIYVDNGAYGWRAKNVKIEVMNSGYADDTWSTKYENTNLNRSNYYIQFQHKPVGAANAGPGFNKIRFTFSDWNNATDFRIAQLGLVNYSSTGLRNTYMSRGTDDGVYRNITPAKNDTYNLGSSTNKWKEVHATSFKGNADTATKLATARKINGIDFDGSADISFTDATTEASGLMSSTDKTKLDGLQNYSNATTSSAGLMSASDKYKLDSMPSGGAFNPDRVLNVSYNSSTQKLTVASVVNGQTVTPPTTLNIHEGHSNFKRTVLYNDAAGTNGNVTLSEQKDNFDELVIVYGFANNEGYIIYKTETMPVVSGKQGFQLEYKYWTAVGKEANAHVVYITENGSTTLVVGHKDKYVINTSGNVQASSSSLGHIKVYKVYGIKYV